MNDEKLEQAHEDGSRSAWTLMLIECLKHLGYQKPEAAAFIMERERAIATLRRVCAEHGDNDWPPDLCLSDIIDKHLARHLEPHR